MLFIDTMQEGNELFEAIGCQYPRNCEDLLGVLEYYEAVLRRNGLVNREGEFRSVKLGLILDLLKIVNIPDNLRSELISAVISSWRMRPLVKTLTQTDEELRKMLNSIEAFRNEVRGAILHPGSKDAIQLDVPIMFVLPLMPSDINTEDVPRIHNLLSQVMNGFASITEVRITSKEKCSGLSS
jgi:hypothetical protein